MRIGSRKSKPRVFLAVPMAGLRTNSAYLKNRAFAMIVLSRLERSGAFGEIYCAIRQASSALQFAEPAEALRADYRALARCDVFLMLFPRPLVSGVLVETGIAIGLKKKICIACRNADDLPFILRGESKTRSKSLRITILQWKAANPEPSTVSNMILKYCTQELI